MKKVWSCALPISFFFSFFLIWYWRNGTWLAVCQNPCFWLVKRNVWRQNFRVQTNYLEKRGPFFDSPYRYEPKLNINRNKKMSKTVAKNRTTDPVWSCFLFRRNSMLLETTCMMHIEYQNIWRFSILSKFYKPISPRPASADCYWAKKKNLIFGWDTRPYIRDF